MLFKAVVLKGLVVVISDHKRPLDRTVLMKQFVTIPLWLYAFVCVLSSLGIVLGLVFLAFNVKFRNKR